MFKIEIANMEVIFVKYLSMASNSIGKIFCVTTFGESHGPLIGVVIDGCPAGLKIDVDFVQSELDRRKPGNFLASTNRRESDRVQFVGGVQNGISTGGPIAAIIKNEDLKPDDYSDIEKVYRPSHADFTNEKKYGIRSDSGGGRSSARETACRVIAGAIAKLILQNKQVVITAFVSQIGNVKMELAIDDLNLPLIEKNQVYCPDADTAQRMMNEIESAKKEGDTLGGIISCVIQNCPVGLGEPVYDKLQADLAKAMLSINTTKGFEYGSGFNSASMKGSEHNDEFYTEAGIVKTKTNFSGGIQGGISNGMDIYFNVAFKPVSTIMMEQNSVNSHGENAILQPKGRHDICVVPRAVPIVEAMAAIVLVDHLLRANSSRI